MYFILTKWLLQICIFLITMCLSLKRKYRPKSDLVLLLRVSSSVSTDNIVNLTGEGG